MAGAINNDEAFSALTTALNQRIASPGSPSSLTKEQRSALIDYAVANIDSRSVTVDTKDRVGVGRVQALYVAGMIATLDDPGTKIPFKDPELAAAYKKQQNFQNENTNQQQSVKDLRGLDR